MRSTGGLGAQGSQAGATGLARAPRSRGIRAVDKMSKQAGRYKMQSCTGAEKRVKRSEGKGESSGGARRKGDERTADEGSEWARLFDAHWLLASLARCRAT